MKKSPYTSPYVTELRWRVRKRVHIDDLQTALTSMTKQGWTIAHVFRHAYVFTIIGRKTVLVRNEPKN